ncbi:hypothetical protein PMALA_036500 [Plasmodium malariae]|nr:hypothetical protein PMALA_036500 [Plasmodium malariae]
MDKADHPVREEEKENMNICYECKSPSLISLEQLGNDELHVFNSDEELEDRKKINEKILKKINVLNNENSSSNVTIYDETEKDKSRDKREYELNKMFRRDKEIYDSFVQREKKKGIKDEIIMKDMANYADITSTLRSSLLVTRKPLYFNRIKTSFDWNKYNKTHYDYENTPPKYICGYKFNIFYTNLLNKKEKPSWRLHPTEDESKVLIIFHAGVPYLDIAFKIVNAEWSYDKHRGFRNVFDKGILQLYFNFKKKRYRR